MRRTRTAGRYGSLLPTAALGLVIAGCGANDEGGGKTEVTVDRQSMTLDMQSITEHLRVLAEARVLLGHQSVGRNILAGLDSLATDAGVPLRILEVNGAPPDEGPGIFHSNIGENGDPGSKCEMFAQLLTAYGEPEYDLAMMKFCYTDLGRDTPLEVAAMLERYGRLVENINEQRPDVELVHVTMPLRADPPGKKTFVKRLIGMSVATDADNTLRNLFNDALRKRYADEPIFDLAAVESTLPDGTRSAFEEDGGPVYTLATAYTEDGGHLNEAARRRAAIAFVKTLASALERAAPQPAAAQASP